MDALAKRQVNTTAEYPKDKFNLLSPLTYEDSESALLRKRAMVVPLNSDDFYPAIGDSSKVSPTKTGLLKIAAAAGLILDPDRTGPIPPSNPSRPENVAYKAVGAVLTDSGWRVMSATYEWDYDTQKRKAKSDKQFEQQLNERWALAETKSLLRLIRAICATKQAYTKEEAERPFVVVRTELNTNEPQVKAEVARRAMLSGSQIFGAGSAPANALPAGEPQFDRGQAEDVSGNDDEDEPALTVDMETGEILPPSPEQPPEPEFVCCFVCGKPCSDKALEWSRTEFGATLTEGHDVCTSCGTNLYNEHKAKGGK